MAVSLLCRNLLIASEGGIACVGVDLTWMRRTSLHLQHDLTRTTCYQLVLRGVFLRLSTLWCWVRCSSVLRWSWKRQHTTISLIWLMSCKKEQLSGYNLVQKLCWEMSSFKIKLLKSPTTTNTRPFPPKKQCWSPARSFLIPIQQLWPVWGKGRDHSGTKSMG